MATVKLLSAFDFFSGVPDWNGHLTNVTSTTVTFEDGPYQQLFTGTFTPSASGGVTGTINTSSFFANGREVFRIDGLSVDASVLANFSNKEDLNQLSYSMLLAGDNTIFGSASSDGIVGFGSHVTIYAGAGNDGITGSSGNDFIDGGAGLDTVYVYGDVHPEVTRTSVGFTVKTITLDGVDTLINVERLHAENGLMIALDVGAGGIGGQAYRLYQAAFNRTPDSSGVGYWISVMDKGMSLEAVAQGFINSQEFKSAYGKDLGNHDLVTKFYENILHRPPEQEGLNFWTSALDKGVGLASVLSAISESQENIDGTAAVIGNGFDYTLWP